MSAVYAAVLGSALATLYAISYSCWMQVAHRFDVGHAGITALAVTPEDCFLAGCQDGYLLVFAPRAPAIHAKFNLGAAPMQHMLAEKA